jgi:hypothetical protein
LGSFCECSTNLSAVNCSGKMSVWEYGRDTDIEQKGAEAVSGMKRSGKERVGNDSGGRGSMEDCLFVESGEGDTSGRDWQKFECRYLGHCDGRPEERAGRLIEVYDS